MEVSFTGSAATVTVSKASVRGVVPTVDDLATGDRAATDALATLRAAGRQVVVESLDAPSLLDVCEIRRVIGTIATKISAISVTPNAAEGKVDITVSAESIPLVETTLRSFASWIRVESGDVALASRTADSAPWYGGARLNRWDGAFLCSTSFRFNNGSQYLLTADHCGPSGYKWYNNGDMYTGGYVGYSASNLGAYGVDTAVIAGSSYGAKVYTGSTTSNSSIAANGVYPNSALQYGDQLVISGAASGQGNITATGLGETCIWFSNATYQYCHLLTFSAVGGVCIGGDSGGPIGVYDPASGRLIASATVTGTRNPTSSDHWCYGTNISAAIYLWGGGTIG
ncbi:hypothetical protein SAMN04488591_1001 [Microbacterium azadirachtae]|uniref:Uncharacterized protein n=2 Tax=Microbacterium azadirachtae TaxID=582680 RepID=A0A1I6GCD7_9MICO|nr:hypothetical protein SAMN04488591_1001 [Microbacterium azadirachtae]